MSIIIKKRNNNNNTVRVQCPHCNKYKTVFYYKISQCIVCNFNFPPQVKTMIGQVNSRLSFFIGKNDTIIIH